MSTLTARTWLACFLAFGLVAITTGLDAVAAGLVVGLSERMRILSDLTSGTPNVFEDVGGIGLGLTA